MKCITIDIYFIWLSRVSIMGKNQKNCLLLKKLIKIKKDQSDNESDANDIDQCNNEIVITVEEVNKI